MRDDFIQGIMFSRSDMLDLRRMSKSERTMYKMRAASKTRRDWHTRPMLSTPTPHAKPGTVITANIK